MICAWPELMNLLPQWLREQTAQYKEFPMDDIRLRIGSAPELVFTGKSKWLSGIIQESDIRYTINAASNFSPWTMSTAAQGFLTAPGGHRIGLCGEAIVKDGFFSGIRRVHSICIRVAKDFSGISQNCNVFGESCLILGAPGWGKTTLLRDLARNLAKTFTVCVVDEREELFPKGFERGIRMDVISGCPKASGIDAVLRTMGPDIIAVDEVTSQEDCLAIIRASGCGVKLLATAHADGMEDYMRRTVYQPLWKSKVFDKIIVLNNAQGYSIEAAA